jgi:alpha-N-acetylglucosaminidase
MFKSFTRFTAVAFCYLTTMAAMAGAAPDPGAAAAEALIRRMLPRHAQQFVCEVVPESADRDTFRISSRDGRILLQGNRPIALAAAFHHYVKHHAGGHFSWCGDQLDLPGQLPLPAEPVTVHSRFRHGYAFNYCTFNYTMAWWDWPRWEREIDLMAANGVDLPLAITGTEAVWLNVLQRFGYSREEAKRFVAGPGYTAWWLMGNLQGRGGPVNDSWIESRVDLQRKILARMRELGMRPVMQGFVGLVPDNLPKMIPGTRVVPQGRWLADQRPAVLLPDDPLFGRMAAAWYEEQEKLFGRCDAFAGDLFHEGGKTKGIEVGALVRSVQQAMLAADPRALWIIQGWGGNPKGELLAALRRDNTLVLELCNEFWRNWEPTRGFNGMPWVFGTVIIYGGNTALHGRLDTIANNLRSALVSKTPPSGIGMAWEGIDSNPVVADFLWDCRWTHEVPDPERWIGSYAKRRYGTGRHEVGEAWKLLLDSAYAPWPNQRRPGESVFCARPSFDVKKVSPFAASIQVHYDQRLLREALGLLLQVAPDASKHETYRHDLVDFTRQFMANAAQIPYREMVAAFRAKDAAAFERAAEQFIRMLDDQNRLLAADPRFLLGRWLSDARGAAGADADQRMRNERNARQLITTWTRERSGLGDYAWREWNGLLERYHRPRWQAFIADLRGRLAGRKPSPPNYFAMESAWAARQWENDSYPAAVAGEPVLLSRELLDRWGPMLDDARRYQPPSRPVKYGPVESATDAR